MESVTHVERWAAQAQAKLRAGRLDEADFDALLEVAHAANRTRRQRVLYLQATTASIRSPVIGMALHEPVPGSLTQVSADETWPYGTVHDAILDGWQVISFPTQRAPFDDREIDVLGYEFILQKLEEAALE